MSRRASGDGGVTSSQQPYTWTDEADHLGYSSHRKLDLGSFMHKHEGSHCAVESAGQGSHCWFQTSESWRQSRSLRVATYNIWNVNSLSHLNEIYEDRIARLGQVRTSHI